MLSASVVWEDERSRAASLGAPALQEDQKDGAMSDKPPPRGALAYGAARWGPLEAPGEPLPEEFLFKRRL